MNALTTKDSPLNSSLLVVLHKKAKMLLTGKKNVNNNKCWINS